MTPEKSNEGVGYGRPPKQHQFKKGQSGNPRGRPKKSGRKPRPGEIDIAGILNGDRTIRTAQGEQRMSGFEILCRAEVMYALKGDVRAAIRFFKRCEAHGVIWTPPRRKTPGVVWCPPGATKEEVEQQFWEERPRPKLKGHRADQAAVLEAVAYERHKVGPGKKRYALELVLELIVAKAFGNSCSNAPSPSVSAYVTQPTRRRCRDTFPWSEWERRPKDAGEKFARGLTAYQSRLEKL